MLDVLVVSGFNTDFENCGNYQLRSQELQFCIRRDDPLAGRHTISLEEAARHPLVLFTKDYYVRHKLTERFQEVKAEPAKYVELYQLSTHFHMIRKHGFAGFFFSDTIEGQPDMTGISLEPPMNINVEIVWRKNSWQYHGVRKFIEYVREYARKTPQMS
jgi:DNA-binding transcriptional LysR family regulator